MSHFRHWGACPAIFIFALALCGASSAGGSEEARSSTDESFFRFSSPTEFPALPAGYPVGRVLIGDAITLVALSTAKDGEHPAGSLLSWSPGEQGWGIAGKIPMESSSIISVNTDTGWVIAAMDEEGEGAGAAWCVSGDGGEVTVRELPPLPRNLNGAAITSVGSHVYIAGYKAGLDPQDLFLRLNFNQPADGWEVLPAWGMDREAELVLANVANQLYLFVASDDVNSRQGYVYSPARGWRTITGAPVSLRNYALIGSGQGNLLTFPLGKEGGQVLSYYDVTDRWVLIEEPLETAGLRAVIETGETSFFAIGTSSMRAGEVRVQATPYSWFDHIVVGLFMVSMLGIGFYLSRRKKGTQDFFRGGRRIPFWASGLSLFATGASSISLMAMPGMAFSRDWTYMAISFYILISTVLVLLVYVPLARRLNVATANEYLELRYGLSLRIFGSLVYSIDQVLARIAAIMLLPAIALSAIFGIPMQTSILIMGLVTTAYSVMGGFEGVIWTDVIQSVVMLFAVFLSAIWAFNLMSMDFGTAFNTLWTADKLHMFDPSLSLLGPTVFVLFIHSFVTVMGTIGNQNFIQRVQCTSSEREAKKAVLTQIGVAVPINFVLFALGSILFLFYLENPEMLNPTLRADGIFPVFAAQNLPVGLAGLVIAALFAATMSTLSSALNSTANLGVEDFYRRLKSVPPSDQACRRMGRFLTLVLGLIGTGAALWLVQADLRSVWDLAIMLSGMILAPISGFFLLGIFTRRANGAGVLIGGLAAILATILVREFSPIHHFLYLPTGVLTCLIVGYLASLLLPWKKKEMEGLTVYTLYRPTGGKPTRRVSELASS